MRIKKLGIVFGIIGLILCIIWMLFIQAILINPPELSNTSYIDLKRLEPSKGFYTIGNNYMQKNDLNLFEIYLEGDPFERGVIYGKLAKELVIDQEHYFVKQIDNILPSAFYKRFLKYLIGWFNRGLDESIDKEYLEEIYGVSLSATEEYNFIGPNYQRILNYHAAHDIGHALADKHMVVGCTSFGAWNSTTTDSTLIVGRNFDFYVGDDFAKDKIVMFVNPNKGNQFMMVTWGGMIGTVSGMNMEGITVTINAAKSDYPTKAATPISIVARKILQYANSIDEAFAIAKEYETFVSETILIGSANDNEVAIIEKTPTRTFLYTTTDDQIICSNHFQDKAFENEALNIAQINETSSGYRYSRMEELLENHAPLNYNTTASLLRNYKGKEDSNIGLGNENAINQIIAHHSIIFEPNKRLVWVSANPVPFNAYVAYDLNKIFNEYCCLKTPQQIDEPQLRIKPDSFLTNGGYQSFLNYKQQKKVINALTTNNEIIEEEVIDAFIKLNPNYYEVYNLIGDYYLSKNQKKLALENYTLALTMNIPLEAEKNSIKEKIKQLK